jgi:NAD(P)-dependent dehydrogenase (short-subunit alcohol dehydrogenase family)
MKTVIITGANRGIGFETALAFGRAGWKVFATARNPKTATALQLIIKDESLPVTILAMDVNSDESVAQGLNDILTNVGSIDVLVNNAGIEKHGAIEELTLTDFKDVMETNYFGVLRCIKGVLPKMRKSKKGCIINVSSVSGRMSSSPLGAYVASKHALESVSEALAQEVKPFNIRVAIVEPGIIDTDMANNVTYDSESIYPNSRRIAELFAESLKTPRPASQVGEKILEIAQSETWQLRHPVGPDALPFLGWRVSMTDEQWIDWNSANDEDYYNAVERDFGMNLRQVKLIKK